MIILCVHNFWTGIDNIRYILRLQPPPTSLNLPICNFFLMQNLLFNFDNIPVNLFKLTFHYRFFRPLKNSFILNL